MNIRSRLTSISAIPLFFISTAVAQVSEPDWGAVEVETLEHFRTLLQFDTSDPNTCVIFWKQKVLQLKCFITIQSGQMYWHDWRVMAAKSLYS